MTRIFITLLLSGMMACTGDQTSTQTVSTPSSKTLTAEEKKELKRLDHKAFHATLRQHLGAIAARDLATLRKSLAPDGTMHLLRPATKPVFGVDKYLSYHEAWFKEPSWSIKSTITDSDVGTDMGYALVDLMYNVPNRNGKPYWNKMLLTFNLKKYDGSWYVVTDHSSSVRKSTDKK